MINISTLTDIYKQFKIDYELDVRSLGITMGGFKKLYTEAGQSYESYFGVSPEEVYVQFDVYLIERLFGQTSITDVPDNFNMILDTNTLKSPFIDSDIEWSIPIINDSSFTFLKSIKEKYPSIKIKNVIVLKPLFVNEIDKLRDYELLDLSAGVEVSRSVFIT